MKDIRFIESTQQPVRFGLKTEVQLTASAYLQLREAMEERGELWRFKAWLKDKLIKFLPNERNT